MIVFVRSLQAEVWKLRRTLAVWMVLLAPLIPVSLQFFILLDRGRASEQSTWPSFLQGTFSLWSIFMLPLFIVLETALVNGTEHAASGWKQMFALPVERWKIYLAKTLTSMLLVAGAYCVLMVSVLGAGLLLPVLKPVMNFSGGIPWATWAGYAWGSLVASLLIVVIHFWLSARFRGFPLPLGVGIGATFFAVFATSARWGEYYPWLLPLNSMFAQRADTAVVLGPAGACLALALMLFDLSRRDVS